MAVITDPPILIDGVDFSTGPPYELTPVIVPRGSVLYEILVSYDSMDPTLGTLHAFKSIDGGQTWTEQDAANSPDAGAQSGYFYTFNDEGRDAIDVLYRNGTLGSPGNNIIICTFDTSTDTWGTPGTPFDISTIPGNATIIRYCIYKQSGGDWVVISGRLSFGPTVIRLYYLTYDGATWSGPTDLTSANNDGEGVWGGRLNANGNFYFLATGGASAHDLFLYQLDPTFVLSTKITLTPPGVFFNSSFPSADMSMTFWGADSIAVGWVSTSGNVQMRIGTPLSAPVFTSYTIASTTGSEAFYYARPIVDADGNLNVFWIMRDASIISPLVLSQVFQSVFDGASWGAPVLFYDAIDNPPPEVTPGFEVTLLHKFDALQLTPGSWIAFTTMGGISSEHANIAFMLLSSGPTSQTLELTKIIAGGPASPSDFTLSATGGSPEVEISGDGHVGPTEVSPGTYELGEVAFPSVTWGTDPDPWGPETWGGNYSQGQWDCGGAFMPTPTSVVVAPGSGGSPYLAATQVPSDPTYRALLSGGKYEFKIGANLYQVLFNSAGKLGVFKRTASVAGSAWTLMDAVHAPGNLSGNGEVTQSGTTIAIAYLESGNVNMRIVEFSTVTDTWGTPTVAKAMLSTLATFAFVRQSSGIYVIIAGRPNAIYAVTNSGGLWGGTTILASLASGATVLSGVVDSGDRIWTLVNTASTTVGVYAISPSLALGAVITTVSLLFPGGPYFYLYYPQIALWGTDGVAVAWNTALTIGGAGTISVKTITPLAAPVVTTSVAYTFGAGTERAYLFQPVDDGSGNLNLFFVDTDTGVNQVLQTLFDGTSTWGATSQFYDAVSDPPPSGTTPSAISALQALKLAAGWTTGLTMQTSGPVDTAEFVEIVSPTNTVACRIVNTFIPTPPPPPPPGGGGENAVGCFELLRIDVTLTPAKRLPVRGSTR